MLLPWWRRRLTFWTALQCGAALSRVVKRMHSSGHTVALPWWWWWCLTPFDCVVPWRITLAGTACDIAGYRELHMELVQTSL